MNTQLSLKNLFNKTKRKIRSLFRSHSWIYLSGILIISLLFVIFISCISPSGGLWLLQTISSSIFSAFIFFLLFNIIYDEIKKSEQESGKLLTHFELIEFISTIKESKVKSKIYIMETWTDLLISESYRRNFIEAVTHSIKYYNTTFNILLLDPENTNLVKERSDELERQYNVEINIYQTLYHLECIRQNLMKDHKQALLEVKLYNIKPTLAIYANQDDLSITFFQRKLSSTKGKTLKFPTASASSDFIIEQFFDIIWDETITETTRNMENALYLDVKIIQINDLSNEKVYKIYKKVKYVLNSEEYNEEHKYIKIFLHDLKLDIDIHNLANEGQQFFFSFNEQKFNHQKFNHRKFDLYTLSPTVKQLFESKYAIQENSVIGLFPKQLD